MKAFIKAWIPINESEWICALTVLGVGPMFALGAIALLAGSPIVKF